MTTNHTQTPWERIDSTQVYAAGANRLIADCASITEFDDDTSNCANASRIVACVNACEGIADPAEALRVVREALSQATFAIDTTHGAFQAIGAAVRAIGKGA